MGDGYTDLQPILDLGFRLTICFRRLLGQGSFYLKQNPGEANLTMNELQDIVREGSHATIMKKLMR